jgi:hypothetical protein
MTGSSSVARLRARIELVRRRPTQVEAWLPGDLEEGPDSPEGQWLTCLRDTGPDDRLVVWEGASGRGLIAVVDFAAQRRRPAARITEGWGRVQRLDSFVRFKAIEHEPVLAERFLGRRHGIRGSPKWLTGEESAAIAKLTHLPPRAFPIDEPSYDEDVIFWADEDDGPPEAVLEHTIHSTAALWRALGFPGPPLKQRRLPSGLRPDLRAPGVVADVKRRIRRNNGPAQVEGYIEELDRIEAADGPWRGLLIHRHDELDPATKERLLASEYRKRLQVWTVSDTEGQAPRIERLM